MTHSIHVYVHVPCINQTLVLHVLYNYYYYYAVHFFHTNHIHNKPYIKK